MTVEHVVEIPVVSTLYQELAASVGPMAHLPNNGAAYHTGEQIITHLNRVLGPGNWSFRLLAMGEEPDSEECWAFGEITATINGVTVVKQDYGSQAFKKARSTGKYVSKWDDKKSAATDALKRCARLLGVGLDAWANERAPSWHPDEDERREVQAEMREQARNGKQGIGGIPEFPKQKPVQEPTPIQKARAAAELTGAPQQDDERADAVAKCQKVMRMALAAGLDFEQRDPTKMTTEQVQDYGKALADMIRAARQAAS